jgi:glycosyltransferase involved in cell wall biosynthesis
MPHRIVFLIGSLDRGGAEGQLVELATRLPKDKFACEIWCLHHRGPIPVSGIPVKTFGYENLCGFIRMLCLLTLDLRRVKPCVVHGFLFESYLAAGICGWLAGVPVRVASRRSLGIFKEHRKFASRIERVASWFTHVIVCNCKAVMLDTIEREPWIPCKKFRIIYNGVDTVRFKPSRHQCHEVYARNVCLVANLIHYKRVDRFLKIAERIHDYLPDASFLIIGNGPCRQALLESVPLCIAHLVTFAKSSDVERMLPYQDVCLLTSDEEGFPNAVLEAMACGVPVVASAVGGVPELIEDGINGYAIEDLDDIGLWVACVLDILKIRRKSLMFAENARFTAEKFSVQRMVLEYEMLYLNLLQANIMP